MVYKNKNMKLTNILFKYFVTFSNIKRNNVYKSILVKI